MQSDPQLNNKGCVVQIVYYLFFIVHVLQSSICSTPEVILMKNLRL